jgi:ribosomal protein S18 acetylase RimI-like enzyme
MLQTHRVEQVRISDAIQFLKLEAECFGMKYSSNTLYYWRPILDYCWAFKATSKDEIVGGLIAMPTRQGFVYINSLFVHPRMRRRGIGSELLETVLRLHVPGFILDVKSNKHFLLRMYRKYGFKITRNEPNYYLDGSSRFVMEKQS